MALAQVHAAASNFAQHLGKSVCSSQDRPGFIVNRVLMPMINEAFYALMEVLASTEIPANSLHCSFCQIWFACSTRSKLLKPPPWHLAVQGSAAVVCTPAAGSKSLLA